jgi:hypothetical protein
MNNKVLTRVSLTNADAGKLQDAYHYAMLILNRSQSTFDGCREYPEGIRGQVKAYEHLLNSIDSMTADNETWQLVKSTWWHPLTWQDLVENTRSAQASINYAASRLGIEARTGERFSS